MYDLKASRANSRMCTLHLHLDQETGALPPSHTATLHRGAGPRGLKLLAERLVVGHVHGTLRAKVHFARLALNHSYHSAGPLLSQSFFSPSFSIPCSSHLSFDMNVHMPQGEGPIDDHACLAEP
jgi:hypothetical protein